jgi:hypothetical protein
VVLKITRFKLKGIMDSHGTWEVTFKFNLLIINLKGSFNVEGVIELQNHIKKVVLDNKLTSWNRLEIYAEGALATPDAIMAIKEHQTWYEAYGSIYVGVICHDSIQQYLIKQLGIENLIIFNSLVQAEKYLLNANELDKSGWLVSNGVLQY